MFKRLKYFSLADLSQQMVGGFLLTGPFVVTEEVWNLAQNLRYYHSLLLIIIVFCIGYGALYGANKDRDPDKETKIAGIPVRFISLMAVTYLSVVILIFLFNAIETFHADFYTAGKVVTIASIFSVIGAATADSLL
ncbi:MAG: DUF2391 family protein [Candidatus Thermoplasmatota archaeon]|nr:DUF2391 family protein [Candidatus Thermoplasmatota archaeon]MBS3817791.1 DUF2391 family protein [Candidatus Thermoplasmatota archaeon]